MTLLFDYKQVQAWMYSFYDFIANDIEQLLYNGVNTKRGGVAELVAHQPTKRKDKGLNPNTDKCFICA
jgi:hypothetical protein